jgi:hypothetical protein
MTHAKTIIHPVDAHSKAIEKANVSTKNKFGIMGIGSTNRHDFWLSVYDNSMKEWLDTGTMTK